MLFNLFSTINTLGALWSRFEYPVTTSLEGNNKFSGNGRGRSLEGVRPPPFVRTPLGGYEGYHMKVMGGREIYAFEGIPFAEPPVPFKAPQMKKPFSGNFSARSQARVCPQTYVFTVTSPSGIFYGDHDCLTCSIFTPMIATENNFPEMPVIINYYGGSFYLGSSNDYGPAYLLEKDMILVNCNYRVGLYGFLSTGDAEGSGNWGLKDAALSVDFIHKYIRHFGGNPNKIILLGQSAGAAVVQLLAISPFAHENKFSGVVALSGSALSEWAVEDPKIAQRFAKNLAGLSFCPTNRGSKVMLDCLRKRNPRRMAALQNIVPLTELTMFQFRPTVEPRVPGAMITDTPFNIYTKGNVSKIPIILSMTSQDADFIPIFLRGIGQRVEFTMKAILEFTPELLEFKGRVNGREREVTQRILKFYGGEDKIRNQPERYFKMVQDRMFKVGFWKSLRLHSEFAPSYGFIFGYPSKRGVAGRLEFNPKDYGIPHVEDLFYIFNRTDVEPIPKSHKDYQIVELYQNFLYNFANTGKFEYRTKSNELFEITKPVDPKNSTFGLFVIEEEAKVVQMDLEDDVIKFWDSLEINEFPSL